MINLLIFPANEEDEKVLFCSLWISDEGDQANHKLFNVLAYREELMRREKDTPHSDDL